LLQQFAVPVLSMFVTGMLAKALVDMPRDIRSIQALLSPAAAGFLLGCAARFRSPAFRRSGKNIWVLPVVVFSGGFLWLSIRGISAEKGLLAAVVMLPTTSCIMYSAAIRPGRAIPHPLIGPQD
jgi:hypothetical protein